MNNDTGQPVVTNIRQPETSCYFYVFLKVTFRMILNVPGLMLLPALLVYLLPISCIHNSIRSLTVTNGYISLISITELIHTTVNN